MPYPSRIDLRDSRAQHLYSILPSSPPLPFPLCVRYIRYTRSFVSVSSVFFFPLLIYHARIPRYPVTYPPSPRPIRRIIFSHALERQTRTSPTPSPLPCGFQVPRSGNSNRDRCSRLCQHEVARNQALAQGGEGRKGVWKRPLETFRCHSNGG